MNRPQPRPPVPGRPPAQGSIAAATAAAMAARAQQQDTQHRPRQQQQVAAAPAAAAAGKPEPQLPSAPQPLPQALLRRVRELSLKLSSIHRYDADSGVPDVKGGQRDQDGSQNAAQEGKRQRRPSGDVADALREQLRTAVSALRSAIPRRGAGLAASGDAPQPSSQLHQPMLPEDAKELWKSAGDLWNHALELSNMEKARKAGLRAAEGIARITACHEEEPGAHGEASQGPPGERSKAGPATGADPDGGGSGAARDAAERRQRRLRVLTHMAWIRHLAVEIVALIPSRRLPAPPGAPAPHQQQQGGGAARGPSAAAVGAWRAACHDVVMEAWRRAAFCLQAGGTWVQLGQLENAEMCLSRAAPLVSLLLAVSAPAPVGFGAGGMALPGGSAAAAAAHEVGRRVLSEVEREEIITEMFELQLERMVVLWRLGQQTLARQTLSECRTLAQELQRGGRHDASCVCIGLLSQALLDYAVEVATGVRTRGLSGYTSAAGAPPGRATALRECLDGRAGGGGGGGGGGARDAWRGDLLAPRQHPLLPHIMSDDEDDDLYEDDYGGWYDVRGDQDDQGGTAAAGSGGGGGAGAGGGGVARAAGERGGGVAGFGAAGGGGAALDLVEPGEAIPLLDQVYELVTEAVQCHQDGVEAAEREGQGAQGGGRGMRADPDAEAAREEGLVWLRDQVLVYLCACHLAAGDPRAALACLGALREADSALAEQPEMASLHIRALSATGESGEALAALEALAASPDTPLSVAWELVGHMLAADPGVRAQPEVLWPAVEALQARLPRDAAPLLDLLRAVYDIRQAGPAGGLEAADRLALAVLRRAPPADADAAAAAAGGEGPGGAGGDGGDAEAEPRVPEAVRRLQRTWALQHGAGGVAGGGRDQGVALPGEGRNGTDPEAGDGYGGGPGAGQSQEAEEEPLLSYQRQVAWAMLWNRGCEHFPARAWQAARAAFLTAAPYAPSARDASRAHQSAALCCLALGDTAGAMHRINIAGAVDPHGPLPEVCFVRFKVLLVAAQQRRASKGDAQQQVLQEAAVLDDPEGVAALAAQLAAAERQQPGLVQVAVQEASAARAWGVARELLLHLHAAAVQHTERRVLQQQRGGGADAADAGGAGTAAGVEGPGPGQVEGEQEEPFSEGYALRLIVRCIREEAGAASAAAGSKGSSTTTNPKGAGSGGAGEAAAAGAPRAWGNGAAAGATDGPGGEAAGVAPDPSPHHDLAYYHGLAAARLEAVGEEAFFAGGCGSLVAGGAADAAAGQEPRDKQLEWFAWSAWNGGLAALEAGATQSAAVLLGAAGRLLGRLHDNSRAAGCRRVAFTLAASCALQVHRSAPPATPEAASALEMAEQALQQAREAGARGGGAAGAGGGGKGPDKVDLQATLTELQVLLARRAPAAAICTAMEAAARSFPPGPACPLSPHDLLPVAHKLMRLAQGAGAGAGPDGEQDAGAEAAGEGGVGGGGGLGGGSTYGAAAAAAYHQVLVRLTSAGDGRVDFTAVAEVVRCLLQLAASWTAAGGGGGGSGDAARLAVLRELAGLLDVAGGGMRGFGAGDPAGEGEGDGEGEGGGGGRGGRAGAYPARDMEHLVSSAWNRGAHHYKFGRVALALEHLRVALSLLRHAPALDAAHRGWMAREVSRAARGLGPAEAATAGPAERELLATPMPPHGAGGAAGSAGLPGGRGGGGVRGSGAGLLSPWT